MVISRHFFTGSRFFVLFSLFSFNLYCVLNKLKDMKNFHSYLLYTVLQLFCIDIICLFQLDENVLIFFSISVFFHEHSQFTGQQEKGEAISLIPLYHFHPLYRHLDITRGITAESSPLAHS